MSVSAVNRKDARQLVQSIAENHGYVHEDDWNSMSLAVRERVRKAVRNLEGIAGVAVTTLAKNLYTSDARFVFELLQNAEDNSFDKVRKDGLTPYVSFEVHPDHIIIDCNEDGFEPKNLKAICAVGQSSKTGVHNGYVGEKGIGFKSVFMAAWKVYIQSNNFSFYFQHKRGDQGLGMISPIWYEPDKALPPPKTRMKLLLGDGHETIASSQYQNILDQFDKLNENILLFMRNLEEIRISIFDKKGKTKRYTTFSKKCIHSNHIRLTKVTENGKKEQDYYIYKHIVKDLKKNENRTYSEYEEQSKVYSTAEIALGFPLTKDSEPIIDYQDIFAYLPMKKAGFRFLINSDFVTQANRQDIVTTSDRNIGIRRGIADAFILAISEFCNHPKLQYTWMRFLPDRKGHQYDPFWSQLVSLLENGLKIHPVLRPRSEKSLRLISGLRFLLNSQLNRCGQPLFFDVSPEKYLSKNYVRKDIGILRNYGLSEYTAGEIVSAVKLDLGYKNSRLKSSSTTDDWHTRSAGYLDSICQKDELLRMLLSDMPLIPLINQKSNSVYFGESSEEDIYFPETGGLVIPPGLDMRIIESKASKNVQRRQLFRRLGAQEATIPFVRRQIFDAQFQVYMAISSVPNIQLLVKQLEYLFLTDKHKGKLEDKKKITVVNSENLKLQPQSADVYMRDNNPFGPSELLKGIKYTDGSSANFLHPSYMDNNFEGDDSLIALWKDWLCKYAGIRRHLRIISKDKKDELSEECRYVAVHQADRFLRFLRYTWRQEGQNIKADSNLSKELRKINVLTQGSQMVILSKTYIPLPNLMQQWKRYSTPTETFPFLNLDEEVTRDTYANNWGFLVSSLSVRTEDDIYFYVDVLLHVMAPYDRKDIKDFSRVFDLYMAIYGKCLQMSDANKDTVREYFCTKKLIYVPKGKYIDCCRLAPTDCVWEGPGVLSKKAPLKALYEAVSVTQRKDFSSITDFFTKILGISNCDEQVIYAQLGDLKHGSSNDFERIHSLYDALWQMLSTKNTKEARALMKDKFEDKAMIYTRSDECWNKVSDCLWSSATTMRGKKILENDYEELKPFFVDILGVPTLNLGLIYEELLKLGKSTPAVASVKEQLFAFNDHLHSIKEYKKVTPIGLKNATIFPVRTPGNQQNILVCNGNEDFAIANRIHWDDSLRPLIKTLDFTLDEIHELEPFVKWIGFEERYLSRIVREASDVGDSQLVPSLSLSRDIKIKAHALCRIAKQYHSPRSRDLEDLQNLYRMLKEVKVFEAEKISCVLIVPQNGKEYSYEMSRSEIHLQETDSNLEIFVPRDERSRAQCLSHALPSRLFQWLTTGDLAQIKSSANGHNYLIVKEILREDPSVISEVLDKDGIVSVHIEGVETSDDEISVSTQSARGEASGLTNSTESDSISALHSTDDSFSTTDFDQDEASTTVAHQVVVSASSHLNMSHRINRPYTQVEPLRNSTQNPSVSTPLQRETLSADLRYSDLLGQVISAARNGSFPTKSIFDLSALRTSLPFSSNTEYDHDDHELSYARGFPSLERDKMVGAAGELYIFELLKACSPSLPDFGIENWKSTIRSYAKKHPEYANMEPWRGFETSDLVYNDTMGVFTKLLIDNCYLDASIWEHRRPTYYFEVKTTTASCETRFFISKKQYKMLHDNRGKEDSVYIIFRVFNLGKSDLGLRVYVDPAELEAKQELLFTPETFSVIPRA